MMLRNSNIIKKFTIPILKNFNQHKFFSSDIITKNEAIKRIPKIKMVKINTNTFARPNIFKKIVERDQIKKVNMKNNKLINIIKNAQRIETMMIECDNFKNSELIIKKIQQEKNSVIKIISHILIGIGFTFTIISFFLLSIGYSTDVRMIINIFGSTFSIIGLIVSVFA